MAKSGGMPELPEAEALRSEIHRLKAENQTLYLQIEKLREDNAALASKVGELQQRKRD